MQDVRYLARTLRREPLFTSIAICSLAFGIGAANTVFSLVDGMLLKPLAYKQPGQIVIFANSFRHCRASMAHCPSIYSTSVIGRLTTGPFREWPLSAPQAVRSQVRANPLN
jgi:hypothetical protein